MTYPCGPSIIADGMKIALQRRLDRYLGPLLCWVLSRCARLRKPASAPVAEPGILVILLSEMGSLVLSQPLFGKLRSLWPGARIHALVFERNREALEMLEVIPPENIVSVSDQSLTKFAAKSVKAVRKMRRFGIDIAIDAELFSRISSIFSFLSGAAVRVGFHSHTQEGLYRGDFINRAVLYNPYQHFSIQLLSLAEAITSTSVPKNKFPPAELPPAPSAVPVAPGDLRAMRLRLKTDFSQPELRRLVLLYPGGGILPIRAWPLRNFQQLSRQLLDRGFAVGIIGLGSDKSLAGQIVDASRHPACLDLTGYTGTVRELIQLFNLAELLVTNDGGPGHLAALTPINTIMLFGPETPQLYRPLGAKTVILNEPTACSPCLTAYNHRHSPCDGENICMQRISFDRVLEEALAILNA